jgi:hypothetical protein
MTARQPHRANVKMHCLGRLLSHTPHRNTTHSTPHPANPHHRPRSWMATRDRQWNGVVRVGERRYVVVTTAQQHGAACKRNICVCGRLPCNNVHTVDPTHVRTEPTVKCRHTARTSADMRCNSVLQRGLQEQGDVDEAHPATLMAAHSRSHTLSLSNLRFPISF